MLVKLECGYPERGDKCRYRCLAISRKRYKTGMQILDGTQIRSRMWSTRNGFISMTFNWVIHSDPKPPQFIILASPFASLAQCVPGAIPVIPPLLHLLLYLLVSFTFPLFPFLLASSVFFCFSIPSPVSRREVVGGDRTWFLVCFCVMIMLSVLLS